MEELREFLDKYNVEYTVDGDTVIAGDIILYSKEITKLPELIGNLKCNYLDLYYNKIEELPESIGNLRCNKLDLSRNKISELPESISNIKCNTLWLNSNQITKLPESIGNIRCNNLYLEYNQISVLPESIGNLRCNNIDLEGNQISELPESIDNIRCNNLWLNYNQMTETPEYDKYSFDYIEITDDYINCDGLFSWFDSIKQVGEYTVYIGYGNYIVTKDNITFAHGKSIRQAISDLIFKLSDRDKSQYMDLNKDSELTVEQAIVMYRVITGACSSGIEGFLQGKIIEDTTTINKIYDMISENDYGYNEFVKFFNLK